MIEPTLTGCIREGFPFRGILFLGLMMTDAGPKLLEYNVRFGDPETQSILVRLETDLVDICESMLNGKLAETQIDWRPGCSACVVLASEGYPQHPKTGDPIHGLDDAATVENVTIFHAGTAVKMDEGGRMKVDDNVLLPTTYLTAGGRVLGVTAIGETLDQAIATAYVAAAKISWRGMQLRRDIGQ
jgi:phosphoribosylamine--glycine ligase